MRKTRLLLLLLVLALVMTSIVACKPDGNDETPGETCTEHVDLNDDGKCEFCQSDIPCTEHVDGNNDGKCDKSYCGADVPVKCETHLDSTLDGKCDICGEAYTTITVAEALELCGESGNVTTERYYVRATVKTVSNVSYGEMTLVDESGEIYVYGTYSHDGVNTFPNIGAIPQRGDEVVLHCILQNYNGTKEVKNARLVGFKHIEADISEYTEMSIADAREAELGELIILEGVVARITYANGYKPSGVILVDESGSIYVYGADVAGNAAIGNKVKVAGVKDYWILDSEQGNAAKFGYKGCNQLSDAFTLENDGGKHEFDKSWITETTVKEIMDTPVSTDITTKIFKVTALIKKAPGQGFINYYIDDLDGVTGTYVYTQCNGGDFEWLDAFDGKICTVYLTVQNAKSSASGCNWRFLPVLVIDEGYKFDVNNAPKFAVDYYALPSFQASYMINAKTELPTSVSSELLGFEGVTLSYTVSDSTVLSITEVDGVIVMQTLAAGKATVTVKAVHGENSYEATAEIEVTEAVHYDALTVLGAIGADNNTEVIVKGIVGPSVVNQPTAFYLIDENGVITVRGSSNEIFNGLSIGDEVVIKGKRTITKDGGGQIVIDEAVLLANYYGEHEYSTNSFITDKTMADVKAVADSVEATTQVYVVTATITKTVGGYSTNYYVDGFMLYSGGPTQYTWLDAFFADGADEATVTLELALCDWNAKGLKGCILAVYNADGTKTYNTLNFN